MKSKFKNIILKTNISLLFVVMISINLQAQKKVKDTLFFTYDSNYITIYPENPNYYYIKDGSGARVGGFYFTEVQKIKNYKTKKREIGLKEFIRSSKFYDENRRLKLRDYELSDYLEDYVIFLVKTEDGKKKYIQVEASFEIE
ncbi:hypothetical protein [Flavobacterium sp. KACC 22763]|uniref:hypothetical protein n=1 Tax=Flavobacterium sp. KACC 22763 TaxID=3025668 RepID=UPI00236551BF|nr:hypothetical protein [Flavobacterium sp. KACC 22763]WDF64745.1 hypothetical protein PQ463_01055 [Flavobacterium sp. KACC 22763]